MKKKLTKISLGLLLMVMGLSLNAQIHSTSNGGNWETTAWIGGIIPSAADDVVINGVVDCNGGPSCNNILITSAGTIRNDYYSGSLTVNGNITNNGSIQNWSSGLALYIKGDIINNGNWAAYYTRPNGTGSQTIICLNGNYFTGNQFHNQKVSGNLYFNGTLILKIAVFILTMRMFIYWLTVHLICIMDNSGTVICWEAVAHQLFSLRSL
ncbi:MAG: hypothetical protein R2764_10945 [Bacteroidales bacterium]